MFETSHVGTYYRLTRTVAVAVGAVLAAGGLASFAAPANAVDRALATCTETGSGEYKTPVDAGGGNDIQTDTIEVTGKISCLDADQKPLISGTYTAEVDSAAFQCTGNVHQGTDVQQITWDDSTLTAVNFDDMNAEAADGVVTLNLRGTAAATSTRFAGAEVTLTGTANGKGCGTDQGESSETSSQTITFTQ